jgi:hypothetical protein
MRPGAIWNLHTTRFERALYLHAPSFQPDQLFPASPALPADHDILKQATPESIVWSPRGSYCYVNHVLPQGVFLDIYDRGQRGKVLFDDQVVLPTLFQVRACRLNLTLWMSMSPSELLSQREGVRKARSDVMIGGLGLGWLLAQVCAKVTVKRLVQVEQSQELVDWLWPVLVQKYPQVAKKATVVVGDAWDHINHFGPDTWNLLDIWANYGQAYDDPQVRFWKTRVKNFWAWGNYPMFPGPSW